MLSWSEVSMMENEKAIDKKQATTAHRATFHIFF